MRSVRIVIAIACSGALVVASSSTSSASPARTPLHPSSHLGSDAAQGITSVQRTELKPLEGTAGDFGHAVAISGDTAVVGAYENNSFTGAAYVFVRSGATWSEQAELTASDGVANDYFGLAVAISGETVVVGAFAKDTYTGAVYVFVRDGTTWSQQAELTASDATIGSGFGVSVAILGTTVIVGAGNKNTYTGAAYAFVRSGTTWSQQAELTASDGATNDTFGQSVAISGNTAVIGAYRKNGSTGAVYAFVRSGTTWSQQAELTASDGAANAQFGYSVGFSGNTAVIGAFGQLSFRGAAYVFVRSGTAWSQQAELSIHGALSDFLGIGVAISGDTAVVGAYGRYAFKGAAYVFLRTGTTWSERTELTASDGAEGDWFGWSEAIYRSTIVVGAPQHALTGAAYVFTQTAAGPFALENA